jgi:hypothetical protein
MDIVVRNDKGHDSDYNSPSRNAYEIAHRTSNLDPFCITLPVSNLQRTHKQSVGLMMPFYYQRNNENAKPCRVGLARRPLRLPPHPSLR